MSHRKNLDTNREAFVEEQTEVDEMNWVGCDQPSAERRAQMRREMEALKKPEEK